MSCDLCNCIPHNIRTSKRHERLRQIGTTERISRGTKTKAVWITQYVCDICSTHWRHVDDPGNVNVGWSLEGQEKLCLETEQTGDSPYKSSSGIHFINMVC